MFKHRLITALVLIPCVLLALFYVPRNLFAIVVAGILLIGGYEWARLCGWHRLLPQALYLAVLSGLFLFIYATSSGLTVLLLSLAWWLLVIALLVRYSNDPSAIQSRRWSRAVMGCLVIVPCWAGLVMLRFHPMGAVYVLLLLLIVWSMDTGAYLIGKRWGRHLLAPHISPKKTWEGLAGGLMLTALVAAVAGILLHIPAKGWWIWLSLTLMTAIVSVIGDLYESMIKRQVGVKDSGSLLPGHGGMLDRIDSLLAAAPIFSLGVLWAGF